MPRLRLSDEEANLIEAFRKNEGVEVAKNGKRVETEPQESTTKSNDYKIKGFTAIGLDGLLMNIQEYCDYYKLDHSKIRSYKLISHTAIPFYNIVFYTTEDDKLLNIPNYFEEVISKHIKPVFYINKEEKDNEWFDRLVYTDTHIGMDVRGNGDPLYDGKWDKEEVLSRLSIMINHTITNKKSDLLIIDNLGDYMDGLGGETTRRGHELPQNMNDKESFDLGVWFGVKLVDSLITRYDKIICNNIVEDNHSGVFGYFVSQAIKGILEQKYTNVQVNSQKKFIDFYKVGNHTFITSHGKDSEALKFGFKPHLDDKQAKKIDHFCKENRLYDGNFIEFSKGDSHLSLFDDSTSTDFQYYNYPSFSPPSNWVKSNFSNTKSGFRFFNINKKENIKNHYPYWFK
jgi:hypothetical protein